MFPTHLSSSKYIHADFSQGGYDCFISLGTGFSDLMAEDDHQSRTENSFNNNNNNNNDEAAGSTEMNTNNNDDNDDHATWLQLSLGGAHMHSTTTSHGQPSIDLGLVPGGGGGSSSRQIQQPPPPPQLIFQVPEFRGTFPTSNTFFLQPHQGAAAAINSVPSMTLQQQQLQETNYNYLQLVRPPFPVNMMTQVLNPPVSSSSSFSGSSEQQHGRPHHVHRRLNVARVVNPPRRPHSGVWFMLQASQNQ